MSFRRYERHATKNLRHAFNSILIYHAFNFPLLFVYARLFQALWQLLWVNPLTQHNSGKSVSNDLSKKNRVDLIQNRVGVVVAELLSQVSFLFTDILAVSQYNLAKVIAHFILFADEIFRQFQDWNNRQQFTSSTDFQADTVSEYFITQVTTSLRFC